MRLKITLISALILCLSGIFMVSCKDKGDSKCASVPCAAGYCEKGNCVCPPGYSGQYCNDVWVVKFSNGWNFKEYEMDGTLSDGPYLTTLAPAPSSLTVLQLNNFWNGSNGILLVLTSATQFHLKDPFVLNNGYKLLAFDGELNTAINQITGTFKIEYQGTQREYKFSMDKM